uniref:histidine phosphatase family protein n=1 Tax=uncultured Sphingomonas sp. TaxID=158754 RepID=UPI0025CDF3EC|nr:histidine phosphatase family protein [uncultured Sphingomonas sp.]
MRHAAHADFGHRLTGRGSDGGLTQDGRSQADALAAELSRDAVAAVYASPRLRTRQTAEAIAAVHGLPATVTEALDEIDFGAWTGRSFEELDGQPEWDRWNSRRSVARCPGGESMTEALDRAAAFVDEVGQRHGGQTVVLVTHCDIIRALLCREHGRSLDDILRFEAGPASVVRLSVGAPRKAAA